MLQLIPIDLDKVVRHPGKPAPTPYKLQPPDEFTARILKQMPVVNANSFIKRWTVDTTLLQPADAYFNASICEHRGKHLLAYRCGTYGSTVRIAELSAIGQPIADHQVDIPREAPNHLAVEDPRLFVSDGRLFLETIGLGHNDDNKYYSSVQICELGDDLQPIASWFPKYEHARTTEKNWGIFSHDGSTYAVYSISPRHVILKIDGDTATRVDERGFEWPYGMGHPRGGCSPILFRNEWYNFVHCVWNYQGQRWYSINLYTFENKPPFRPARILPFPMLLPDVASRWNETHPNVVFPCGVIRDEYKWVVSFGNQDLFTEIAEWDGNRLELSLEPIKGGPYDLSLRPGWHDVGVWRDVYTANDYELPDRFESTDTIVDVGAHVGSFTRACLDRGAGLVVAAEPEFGTHWRANLSSYGDRSRLVEQAIGGESARSCVDPYDGETFACVSTRQNYRETIQLGSVLQGLGPVRLLKLDCEGPEFSIVAETDLSQVQAIIGEVHPYRDGFEVYDWPRFEELLIRQGFAVTKAVRPGATWLFWSQRQ